MSSVLPDVDKSKGALSATAVFIVMSSVVTAAYATGSASIILEQLESSNQGNAINQFSNTVIADARAMCDNSYEQSSPIANNYTSRIPGLQSLEVKSNVIVEGVNLVFEDRTLEAGSEEGSKYGLTVDSSVNPVSPPGCDLHFNGSIPTGSVSNDDISGMNPSAGHKYRIFSDSQNDVTVQIRQSSE